MHGTLAGVKCSYSLIFNQARNTPMTILTANQISVITSIATSDFHDGRPVANDQVWFWADEMAKAAGISKMAVGGVISSLQKLKLIGICMDGNDSTVWLTDAGAAVWESINAPVAATNSQEDFVAALLA